MSPTRIIDVGDQLTFLPTYGDEPEAVGRVVASTVSTLDVRVGKHPWLQAGTRLTCSARRGQDLLRFTAFIESVHDTDGFSIRIPRPVAFEDVNRRSEPRLTVPRQITWARVVEGRLTVPHQTGTTIDLSEGGLSFETTARPPEKGALVAISIDLPIGEMVILGHVTGIDDNVGVHFSDRHCVRVARAALPPNQQADFQKWLSRELMRLPVSGLT